jgi:NAD-dependent SIR2 family protein deacetylase
MTEEINCGCVFCQRKLPFDLPDEIIKATINGDLVIFAGAGISTETKDIFKETLYEDVLADMENPPKEELDFPSLMALYCKTNINGRQKLLQKVKYRFDYCQQFSELYNRASQFHQELSSIYFIKSIVTTNWDDYFEKECGAVPIVVPEDFAFHNLPDRKVYKIHGSISNYGTVIATKEDYDKCYKELNKGIIGSYLKTILATKTVVFIGYSFRDYDFLRIYNYLKKELKSVLPHCYIVTLDSKKPEQVKNENLTVIKTDGTYFLSAIRKHLEGAKYLFPKENIEIIYVLKYALSKIHKETSDLIIKHKIPNTVYCAFYQDGLRHAFDYLVFHANSGLSFFPQKIFNSVDTYRNVLRRQKSKAGNYADIAYIDGYIVGLQAILMADGIKGFPFWFLYGVGPISEKKIFDRAIKKKEVFHKQADAYGKRFFKKVLDKDSELVFHHRPFL